MVDIFEKNDGLMTVSHYAEHRGVSRQAVHMAVKSGRLDSAIVRPTLKTVLFSPALYAEVKGIPKRDIDAAIKDGRLTESIERHRGKNWIIAPLANIVMKMGIEAADALLNENEAKFERLFTEEEKKIDTALKKVMERFSDSEFETNLCLIWEYLSPKKQRGDRD